MQRPHSQLEAPNCANCLCLPFRKFQGITDEWQTYVDDLCDRHLRDYLDALERTVAKAQQENWKQYFIDVQLKRIALIEEKISTRRLQPPSKKPRLELKEKQKVVTYEENEAAELKFINGKLKNASTQTDEYTDQLPEEALQRFRDKGYTVCGGGDE